MNLSLDQLTKQALNLPAESRALLADQLVESLAATQAGEFDKLWASEALRRRDEIRSGKVAAIPGDQVLAQARRAAGRP